MTTLPFPALASSSGRRRSFAQVLAELWAGMREGRAIEVRYQRLSRCSNAELAQMGIERTQIPQLAARGFADR